MKVAVRFSSASGHQPGVVVDLPDDYVVTPRLWMDLQASVIAKLQAAQAAGQVADCITGCDGDRVFLEKMNAVFKVQG